MQINLQDVLFFIILVFLLYKRSAKLAGLLGIAFLVFSMINFALLVSFRDASATLSHFRLGFIRLGFFTAERLTWYAAAFFLLTIIFQMKTLKKQ